MNRWIVFFIVMFMLQSEAVNPRPSSAETGIPAENHLIDIAGTVKKLNTYKVGNGDTDIPDTARPLVTVLKHQLRDLIVMKLCAFTDQIPDVAVLRETILADLKKQGIDIENSEPGVARSGNGYDDSGYTYGVIGGIDMVAVDGMTDLIAVTTSIEVNCGEDTSFYLFQYREGKWERVISVESNGYKVVSGAQGSFQYRVVRQRQSGDFYVITTDVNPWCSSNWQAIRCRVFKKGRTPEKPVVLLRKNGFIFLGNENYGEITVQKDGFKVTYDGSQGLDPGILVRRQVMAFRVKGNTVMKIPPYAEKPEDFLDEWFSMNWKDASKWIEHPGAYMLRKWHKRFNADRSRDMRSFYTEFSSNPPSCRLKNGIWQIGISISPEGEKNSLPKGVPQAAWFYVSQRHGDYYVKGVSVKARKCKPLHVANG